MASTWLIEWRMRSSWGLSLVFGRNGAAATAATWGADALEPPFESPERALLLPAGASSELLLVEAAAGTGIRHTEQRS
jgi:hypothetical protein